jgi:hypothetical protein
MSLKSAINKLIIKFLLKQKKLVNDFIEAQEPERPEIELNLNECYALYCDNQTLPLKNMYLRRLNKLRTNVGDTILFNNGRLTISQIAELEFLKSQLKSL